MTRFSAPFKIKQAFSETTVASIDSSGNLQIDGAFTPTGKVSAAAAGNFIGPISSGSAAATGFAVLVQQTTVLGATKLQVAKLPEGADLLDVTFFVKTTFASAAGTPSLIVGTSAIDDAFLRITNVTALGQHKNGVATSAGTDWDGLSGVGATIHAHVTVASGAINSAAVGIVSVFYVHKV
jgi:hypothetical protein